MSHVFHQLYYHFTWATHSREPLVDRKFRFPRRKRLGSGKEDHFSLRFFAGWRLYRTNR